MTEPIGTQRILLVEDNRGDARLIQEMLREAKAGLEPRVTERLADALAALSGTPFDAVLLDLGLPDSEGIDTYRRLAAAAPQVPVVVLSGLDDEQLALQAVHDGAQEYLVKGSVDGASLYRSVVHAIERQRLLQELQRHRDHLGELVAEQTAALQAANADLQQDIARRCEVEEALRASERKYRTLVDSSRVGIILMQGRPPSIRFGNPAMARILGRPPEDPLSFTADEVRGLVHPSDYDFVVRQVERRVAGEKDVPRIECRMFRADGEERWIEAIADPVEYQGSPALVVQVVDITDKRRWDEERARLQKIESLGLVAGGIAHDFNNLLTGVVGNVSLAKALVPPGSAAAPRLEHAERALSQATRLVRQLMSLAKGGEPVKQVASLRDIAFEAATLALAGSALRFDLSAPPDLWPVEVDPTQIGQVVQNLAMNALQATPGGGTLELALENVTVAPGDPRRLKPGRHVLLRVTDHGVGIPPEHLQRIFDPYFSTKRTGSGLGLTVVYSSVLRHGGHISVESTMGSGTTFRVWLPASGQPGKPRAATTVSARRGSGRILVMDDEDLVRDVCARCLEHLGYEVTVAADGEEAVRLHREALRTDRPYDLLILDLTVPGGMGGREALEKIREAQPGVKAIASSGYSDDLTAAECRRSGFLAGLAKPYGPGELSEVIRAALGG